MVVFTLYQETIDQESEYFERGKIFNIQEEKVGILAEDAEIIVKKIYKIYEDQKEDFKNNKVFHDLCNIFVVKYYLQGTDSYGNFRKFDLWSDKYYKDTYGRNIYHCESTLKSTKKMKRRLPNFIEFCDVNLSAIESSKIKNETFISNA